MNLIVKVLAVSSFLTLLVICISIAAGLASFFGIQKQELETSKHDFDIGLQSHIISLDNIVTATKRAVNTISSLFEISTDKITPYDHFHPFIETSQVNIVGVHSIGWVAHVEDSQRNAYINEVRTYGQHYTNFTFTTRNSVGQLVTMPTAPSYNVLYLVSPILPNIGAIGFNLDTEPIRRNAIVRAIALKRDAVTSRIFLPHIKALQPGVLYLSPVITNNTLQGFGVGVFIVGDMFEASFSDIIDNVLVAVFDRGNITRTNGTRTSISTVDDWYEKDYNVSSFLWSNSGEYGPNFGSSSHIEEMLERARQAPYSYVSQLSIGDRVWDIVYIPKERYLGKYRSPISWVVLVAIILIGVIVSILIVSTSLVLYHRWNSMQKMHSFEMGVVQKSSAEQRRLLNRVARIDGARKEILNTIPDLLAVVNKEGRIIYTNNVFQQVLGYSDADIRGGISIHNVFAAQNEKITLSGMNIDFREAVVENRLQNKIPIAYCSYILNIDEEAFSGELALQRQSNEEEEMRQNHLYVVVIRDLRDNKALLGEIQKNKDKIALLLQSSEFEQKWERDKPGFKGSSDSLAFRHRFLQYCIKDKSDENVYFLQDVERYKNTVDYSQRVQEQEKIMRKFIYDGAQYQINLMSEALADLKERSIREPGDIHLFDKIVMAIKITIITDIYPRFVLDEQKRDSVTSTTSTNTFSK